jgi:thymidylate synthase ThyX
MLELYSEMVEPMKRYLKAKRQKTAEDDDATYEGMIKGRCADEIRFLLPAGMMANMGMTANARTWEYAISKWLSAPLLEVNKIGGEVKKEVMKVCPTLVKYAEACDYLSEVNSFKISEFEGKTGKIKKVVEVVDYDKKTLDKLVASIIYRKSNLSINEIKKISKTKSKGWKLKVIADLVKNRSEHDKLPRVFEEVSITFDILCDQGAFFDLKRQRMVTQIKQDLGVAYGYMMPKSIKELGFEEKYAKVMEEVKKAYKIMVKKYPEAASYIVPKAYNRRFLLKMNLRELFYFVRLRARKTGNFTYRRVAMACLEEAKKKYPELMELFFEEKELESRKFIEKEFIYKLC